MIAFDRIARVSVGRTNRDPCDLVDVARRQTDHLGPVGMVAKLGQTDEVFLERGYLSFVFPDSDVRRRFTARVDEHCHPAVKVKLFRRRRR